MIQEQGGDPAFSGPVLSSVGGEPGVLLLRGSGKKMLPPVTESKEGPPRPEQMVLSKDLEGSGSEMLAEPERGGSPARNRIQTGFFRFSFLVKVKLTAALAEPQRTQKLAETSFQSCGGRGEGGGQL